MSSSVQRGCWCLQRLRAALDMETVPHEALSSLVTGECRGSPRDGWETPAEPACPPLWGLRNELCKAPPSGKVVSLLFWPVAAWGTVSHSCPWRSLGRVCRGFSEARIPTRGSELTMGCDGGPAVDPSGAMLRLSVRPAGALWPLPCYGCCLGRDPDSPWSTAPCMGMAADRAEDLQGRARAPLWGRV